MDTTKIYFIVYFIIGLIVSYIYTNIKYGKEIDYDKNIQHAAVNLYMLVITMLWPLFLIKYIFLIITYVRYKRSHKYKL